MKQSFSVPFTYPVVHSDDAFAAGDPILKQLIDSSGTGRAVVFLDSGLHAANASLALGVQKYLAERLAGTLQIIDGGEIGKSGTETLMSCCTALNFHKIDRHAYVIAIGGGAMLDVVGFAAAIVHRGVRLIRMPSTVLAQNDAGIGVKNGINYFGKKNFLGTFSPPFAVINDFSLLRTLSPEQWRDGTAEAVKVALIRDNAFFEWIETHTSQLATRDADSFRYLIRRCAELHLEHITTNGDPFERGSARPLDFGHWSAHKLESLSNYQISHGHAVAIGMAIDVTYAVRLKICTVAVADRILKCLVALRFPLEVGERFSIDVDALLDGVTEFQEHLGGALFLSMVEDAGRAIEIHSVELKVMRECARQVLFG